MNETVQLKNGVSANGGATAPSVLALLERIDLRLARLEGAVDRLQMLEHSLPGALAAATDTLDDVADRLRDRGVDLDQRAHVVADVAERLTSPEALKALSTLLDKLAVIQHLLDSGILAAPSVDVVGRAGYALATARAEETREVGLWGAARAMSDDDVKRALGFVIRVAQLFGRSLGETPSAPRLEQGEHS
jgi:uncharacterized protein YjgD (DUF1641 family)